ncbi:hypothetical protein C8R46DRAFT_472586 [Mycena filopes]|nr:hypothetical protein C8R46DRAFT_472586 [Mycena filopes]
MAPSDPSNYDSEALAIQSLSLDIYHEICVCHLTQFRSKCISTAAVVRLEVIVAWPTMLGCARGVEIASLPKLRPYYEDWSLSGGKQDADGEVMKTGWTRFNCDHLSNANITLIVDAWGGREGWLSQANYVFSSLHIKSELETYAAVASVWFSVIVGKPTVDCPPGYLFLCPNRHFRVTSTTFKWPDTPAYWSLDASGVDRLSTEEATRLGFPPLELSTKVVGQYWPTSVYTGLRQFHRAKGFDPDSQDVARHLGLPLYQLPGNVDPLFAHVTKYHQEDEDRGDEDGDEDENDSAWGGERGCVASDEEEESTSGVGGQNRSSHVQSPADDEEAPETLNILMKIQLLLMLFIVACWVYDKLC